MPSLPISTVRTSTPLNMHRLIHQLHADQTAVQQNFAQLSSGRRVLNFSDDPAAAGRALGLQQGIRRGNQLVRNAGSVATFYAATDNALARVDGALIEARGVTVEAAQNVIDDDQRAALATTVRQAINTVIAAGNTMFRDHQMLGGILNGGDAFRFEDSEIVYRGSNAVGYAQLGAGRLSEVNLTGNEALGVYAVFLEGEPLDAALADNSRLVDLRAGRGVSPGVIRFSGGGDWVELDLRDAATIGDVAQLIGGLELEGRPLTATLTNDGIQIDYADGLPGTLAIEDAEGSSMAEDLSISSAGSLPTPPVTGDGLSPRVTPLTRISDLAGGNGIDLTAGFQIRQGEQTFVIDVSQAETLSDVLIAINRSGADVRAELDPAEGRIRLRSLRSGVDYAVGEHGGDTARDLGIRSATESTRLEDLGRGRGLVLNPSSADLVITRTDGVELEIDLENAVTVADVMDAIRFHPLNTGSQQVLVSLNDFGNGIRLSAPPGANPLSVRQDGVSNAGVRLGLIPEGEIETTGAVVGAVATIIGSDYARRDAGGALDTLLRLERAVLSGDIVEIERLQAKVDLDLDQASRARGRVGVWSRNLEQLQSASEDSVVQMQAQLSAEVDADFAQVISELSQRQLALDASLRLIGQVANLTVLNYL